MKSIFGTSSYSRSLIQGLSTPSASSAVPSTAVSLTSWAELTENEEKEHDAFNRVQELLLTSPANVTSDQRKFYDDHIKELKSKLPYVVVNSIRTADSVGNKTYGKNKGKGKGKRSNAIVSKAYNEQAGRPGILKSLRTAQITCMLNISFVSAFSTSATIPAFGASSFNMGQFNGTAQYLGLFDQYRFDEIEAWMEPQASNLTTSNVGLLTTCIDVDDANAPSTIESVADHQNSLSTSGITGHYHRWKPHMAVACYSGAFTSFANEPASWIDSASNTVQHYGIKYASPATTAIQNYNLIIRARCSFRQAGL